MALEPGWKTSVNVDAAFAAAPLQQKLKQARAVGCDEVELTIGDDASLATDIAESGCVDLAKQVQSAGLAISALCLNEPCASGLVSPVAEDRRTAVEQVTTALDHAAWMGTDVLVLGLGATGDCRPSGADRQAALKLPTARTPYDETCAFALESLLALRFEAEARAVHLACRNSADRFLLSPSEMRDLIDRLNSPWCGVCVDLTAALFYGKAEHWICGLGHRIVCVRLGEQALAPRGQTHRDPSAHGATVDWPFVRSALSEIAYTGPLTYCDRIDEVSVFKGRFDQIVSA